MFLLEISLDDLNPVDRKKVYAMHNQLKNLQLQAIEAYESGNYDLAETLDEEYENLAEKIENILIDLDDFEQHDGREPEDEREYSMHELEAELASSYAEFSKGRSYHIRNKDELVDRLRAIVKDYSFYFGGLSKKELTDDELIQLAKDLNDKKLDFKRSRGFK